MPQHSQVFQSGTVAVENMVCNDSTDDFDIDCTYDDTRSAHDSESILQKLAMEKGEYCSTNDNDSAELLTDNIYSTPEIDDCTSFKSVIIMFIAKLYNRSKIPRTKIDAIFLEVNQLLGSTLSTVEESVENGLKSSDEFVIIMLESIHEVVEGIKSEFSKFSTERKRFNEFEACKTFVQPQSYVIGEGKDLKGAISWTLKLGVFAAEPQRGGSFSGIEKVQTIPTYFKETAAKTREKFSKLKMSANNSVSSIFSLISNLSR